MGPHTLWSLQGHYYQSKTDTDKNGGPGGDSFGTYTQNSQVLFRSQILHEDEQEIQWKGTFSLSDLQRDDNTLGPSTFRGSFGKAEASARKNFSHHSVLAGMEGIQESGKSNEIPQQKKTYVFGAFIEDQFHQEKLHANLGLRVDRHEIFGLVATERFSVGYWIWKNFRWKSSIGTGFKSPSLYQLYSSYGNPNLAAEKSIGGDSGFEWITHNWKYEIYYFENKFKKLIDYDSATKKYLNIGSARTRGYEISAGWNPSPWFLRQSFTAVRAIDGTTGQYLLRRPHYSYSFEAGVTQDKYSFSLDGHYTGAREDSDPITFQRKHMPPFLVVGMAGSKKITASVSAQTRIENLLNRQYQETAGYGRPGVSAYVGIEAKL